MTEINSIGTNPITVSDGGTGAITLTAGGVLIGAGTGAVTATLTPSGLTSLSANSLTAASGNVTATSGNFVAVAAGSGLSFPVTTGSGAQGGTVNCNGRAGSVTFTTVSIAAGANLSFVIGNTSITGASTVILYTVRGATDGTSPVIKSVTNAAGTSTIVLTNGTTVITDVADKIFDFIVLN